jgi:hypothetical protein
MYLRVKVMTNFQVAVIIGASVLILYFFWNDAKNNTATVFTPQGPLPCGGNLNTGPDTSPIT